jgi:alpha-1,3-glucosyltransferase
VHFTADPFACLWFLHISTFSMLPLLLKDGLLGAYLALTLIFLLLPKVWADLVDDYSGYDILRVKYFLNLGRTSKKARNGLAVVAFYASMMGAVVLCAAYLWLPPPAHLEFLYPLLVSAFSCVHFVGFFLYFNYKQLFC